MDRRRAHGPPGCDEPAARDPETSALLAEEEVVLDGNWAGYAAGTVIGWAAYVESTVVDEVRTRPGGSTVSDKLRG